MWPHYAAGANTSSLSYLQFWNLTKRRVGKQNSPSAWLVIRQHNPDFGQCGDHASLQTGWMLNEAVIRSIRTGFLITGGHILQRPAATATGLLLRTLVERCANECQHPREQKIRKFWFSANPVGAAHSAALACWMIYKTSHRGFWDPRQLAAKLARWSGCQRWFLCFSSTTASTQSGQASCCPSMLLRICVFILALPVERTASHSARSVHMSAGAVN